MPEYLLGKTPKHYLTNRYNFDNIIDMKLSKICQNCNKKFETYNERLKFCSRDCYFESRWGKGSGGKCAFCGKSIKRWRYCDKNCRNKF